jgi:hypothetical protein
MGFRKRGGGWIFTKSVDSSTLARVALMDATYPGVVQLTPIVGVHHVEIERLVREFSGSSADKPGSAATFARPLGYVMPDRTIKNWVYEPGSGLDESIDDMLENIEVYGVPFMISLADLARLVAELPSSSLHPLGRAKRIAIACAIQEDNDAAVTALAPLQKEIADFGVNRLDCIQFVDRFSRHFGISVSV